MAKAPPMHRAPGSLTDAQRKALYEKTRLSSHDRGYNTKWQRVRLSYLKAHPLCVQCQAEDVVEPATEVDHIIPHKGNKKLFWDNSNWQPLCKRHHSEKTSTEGRWR